MTKEVKRVVSIALKTYKYELKAIIVIALMGLFLTAKSIIPQMIHMIF